MHFDPGSSSPRKPEFRRKPESILICACGLPFGSSVPTQAGIHFYPRSSFRRKPKSILICACGLPYGSSFPRTRESTLIRLVIPAARAGSAQPSSQRKGAPGGYESDRNPA
jgi:hypothetical protein